MITRDVDVAIVGGGCVGASIFSELALAGVTNVTLIDRGREASATAHSGGMTRVFHESPEHVSLALRHRARLAVYERHGWMEAGSANGALYFFTRDRYDGYAESLRLMQRERYPFEVVGSEHGRKCFPQFRWESHEMAIYEPCAGQASPMAFADAALAIGMRHGSRVCSDVEVNGIDRRRGLYRIATSDGTIVARALVLAGGARMLPLLAPFGVPLQVKELSAVIATPCEAPNYFDRETLEYGGFGLAHHATLSTPQPTRMCRSFEVIGEARARDCYSVDRLGARDLAAHPKLVIATGWGGTAFKLALGIASSVVQRLTARSTAHVSA